jgi:hypothetical protein
LDGNAALCQDYPGRAVIKIGVPCGGVIVGPQRLRVSGRFGLFSFPDKGGIDFSGIPCALPDVQRGFAGRKGENKGNNER